MADRTTEMGSEFHWSDEWPTDGDALPWPDDAPIFATGQGILAVLRPPPGTRPRLHLPSYFCHDSLGGAAAQFDFVFYRHLPGRGGFDLSTLATQPGDWVLVANLFGAEEGATSFGEPHDRDIVLIEDHTHDPLSGWAYATTADYAFASLRKTLPIPDGAVLWSPTGLDLPAPVGLTPGGGLKLEAMLLKRAYLQGAPVPRNSYRGLQIHGERQLRTDRGGNASALSKEFIRTVRPWLWRSRRGQNVRLFLDKLGSRSPVGITPVLRSWPISAAPFAAVLECDSAELRASLRSFLIERGLFPAFHWPIPTDNNPLVAEASELSSRLLTVPLDQRYGPEDVDRVVDAISAHGRQSA